MHHIKEKAGIRLLAKWRFFGILLLGDDFHASRPRHEKAIPGLLGRGGKVQGE